MKSIVIGWMNGFVLLVKRVFIFNHSRLKSI